MGPRAAPSAPWRRPEAPPHGGPARRGGARSPNPAQARPAQARPVRSVRDSLRLEGRPGAHRRSGQASQGAGAGRDGDGARAGAAPRTFSECSARGGGTRCEAVALALGVSLSSGVRAAEWRLFSVGSRAVGCGHRRAGQGLRVSRSPPSGACVAGCPPYEPPEWPAVRGRGAARALGRWEGEGSGREAGASLGVNRG